MYKLQVTELAHCFGLSRRAVIKLLAAWVEKSSDLDISTAAHFEAPVKSQAVRDKNPFSLR